MRKTDKKIYSLYESVISTLIGFVISLFAWTELLAPWLEGLQLKGYALGGLDVGLMTTLFYIVLAFIRAFIVRRIFVFFDRGRKIAPRKSDRHLYTFYESLANMGLAFLFSFTSWMVIVAPFLEWYQLAFSASISGYDIGVLNTIFYTILSLIRGFILRRAFVWVDKRF